MIKKERSLESKNSNSLNAMIKKTSMTFTHDNLRKITAITTAIIMLSAIGTFGINPIEEAFAKGKPQNVIDWSNGFPSGPHWNLNIHGKKLGNDPENSCDNSPSAGPFGASVFLPLNTTEAIELYPQYGPAGTDTIEKINFVSNKRSTVTDLTVLDPCGAPFGNLTGGGDVDEILVQYPTDMEAQVYWRILGNHGGGPNKDISEATITHPALLDTCNFLPEQYEDGSVVQWFDPDCTDCVEGDPSSGTQVLDNFLNGTEMYENSTIPIDTVFSLNHTIYAKDMLNTGNLVEVGDVRIANAFSWGFLDGDPVSGGNSDVGISLYNFTTNFKYNDTNTDTHFSVDETVYNDVTGLGKISPGDIRVANAASVGLDPSAGGDLLSCEDSEQLVGLGLVSNQGVFGLGEDGITLERFDTSDTDGENAGNGNKQGKSKAMNVTGLFKWTGFVCEAAGLDDDGDNKLTFADFDLVDQDGLLIPDGNITAVDLDYLNTTKGFDIDPQTILDAEANEGTGVDNDGIDSDAEFDVWINLALASLEDGNGELLCQYQDDAWIFDVADIVLYGFDYKNNGSSLTQLRFYPIDTLTTEG